jgi:hypothetical protein
MKGISWRCRSAGPPFWPRSSAISECFDAVYLSVADPEKYRRSTGIGWSISIKAAARWPAACRRSGDREDGVFLVRPISPLRSKAALRLIELAGDSDVCITTDAGHALSAFRLL